MRKDLKNRALLYIIGSLTALVLIGFALSHYLTYKHNNIQQDFTLQIPTDASYTEVMDSLERSGAFRSFRRFQKAAAKRNLEEHFEPGNYRLVSGMSNDEIIRTIANAWETPYRLVIGGHIRSIEKLASVLDRQLEADSAAFHSVLTDSLLIDSLGFTPETFIGMFIPNTYEVYWTISPRDFLLRMHQEYQKFWNERRSAKARSMKMTPMEIITMASIVAEESNYVPEQPTIAGVYMNRIRKGIRLQADPTVRFIAVKTEPDIKRILKKHLRLESPYNTYKHRGLPPGPICIPSIDAIEAVLNYQRHNYLYFCAKPTFDGTHSFASDYNQHMANARAYQRELSRLQREQRAAQQK